MNKYEFMSYIEEFEEHCKQRSTLCSQMDVCSIINESQNTREGEDDSEYNDGINDISGFLMQEKEFDLAKKITELPTKLLSTKARYEKTIVLLKEIRAKLNL